MTAAVDPLGTPPMFDVPGPAPRRSPSAATPHWAKYRPQVAAKCDDCLTYLHQNGGVGPVPATARHRRTAGTTTRLLCDEHAQQQRTADKGLTP